MQKTIYKCDECLGEIGDNTHISLRLSNESGIALPPNVSDILEYPVHVKKYNDKAVVKPEVRTYWKVTESLQGKFVHFCNGQCIGRYFAKLIKKANGTK